MKGKKTYIEIKGQHSSFWHIPYPELLNTYEWDKRRTEILKRDKNLCKICNRKADEKMSPSDKHYYRKPNEEELKEFREPLVIKGEDGDSDLIIKRAIPVGILIENPIILHVHHEIYFWDSLPWEYYDNELVSVCAECHSDIHEKQVIPVYNNRLERKIVYNRPCERCNGIGYLQQYTHYHKGVCFTCNGLRFKELYNRKSKLNPDGLQC